jgi:hypothetical protein
MDQVYGSCDHNWLSVHGGLATVGQHMRFRAQEVVGFLTNSTTCRRSMVLQ